MKWICVFSLVLFFGIDLIGQIDSTLTLGVSLNKTSSIVFPTVIKSVDRGNKDLLAQKVMGAENVLQLKARKDNFNETNLTVITVDGRLYSFDVHYAREPVPAVLRLDSTGSIFEKVALQKRSIYRVRDANFDMLLRLKGLFIQQNILYWQLELENRSNISFDIDLLRFYIRDQKQARRSASQELEESPLQVYGNTTSVGGQTKQVIVVGMSKFTIPDKKIFYIQVMEKNGGRHLRLKITNNTVIGAKTL